MRALFWLLLALSLVGCVSPKKTQIPVDSQLKQFSPPPEAEVDEDTDE